MNARLELELDRAARDADMCRAQSEALVCRVDELTDELDELRLSRQQLWEQCADATVLRAENERLRAERDSVQAGWRS